MIVEVDAKYIKGMLTNPDVAPSASINRWIVSILMFHFELVHVPGIRHGPDGLSRRRPQPGDEEDPEDDFEDWIDEVNGFMHVINTMPTSSDSLINTPPITAFISDNAEEETPGLEEIESEPDKVERTFTYDNVPRSPAAAKADDTLLKVQPWLETLQRPSDTTNSAYKTFM